MNPYKQKTPIQIRFKDIDRLGHVNNANHVTYFELARVDYFNALAGDDIKIDWVGKTKVLSLPRLKCNTSYLLFWKIKYLFIHGFRGWATAVLI